MSNANAEAMKISPTPIARNELVFIRYQEAGTPIRVDNVDALVNWKNTAALFASLVSSCPEQGEEAVMESGILPLIFRCHIREDGVQCRLDNCSPATKG